MSSETPAPAQTLRQRLGQRVPEILIEATSVVFAVLLALAINQCQQSRSEQALASEALERLSHEIRSNREQLAASVTTQTEALAGLSEGIEAFRGTGSGRVEFNLVSETLGDTAWQTAIRTQAVRFMDFDTVSRISNVYALQQLVTERTWSVMDLMSQIGIHDDDARVLETLRAVRTSAGQLLDLEAQLIERYDRYLDPAAPTAAEK